MVKSPSKKKTVPHPPLKFLVRNPYSHATVPTPTLTHCLNNNNNNNNNNNLEANNSDIYFYVENAMMRKCDVEADFKVRSIP